MNHKKSGALKYLSLMTSINSYSSLKLLLDSCKVSDHMHELWYGDKKIAKEMTKEQLEAKFEFGLSYLNISRSILNNIAFKHKETIKRKDPQWPNFMAMFAASSIETINFSQSKL